MKKPIHHAALKHFRTAKRMTQKQVAEETRGGASLVTIKRIEGAKDGAYLVRERIAEGIAKVLGVTVEKLASPPENAAETAAARRDAGYRELRVNIDAETSLAFRMVEHLYDIPIRSQVEMAPLFAALLAEGSLAWRRRRLAEVEEAADALQFLGSGHLSFAGIAYRVEDAASQERKSIEKRDLFGKEVADEAFDFGYDPAANNPFADFLKQYATEIEAKAVSFEGDWSGCGWKTGEGMPEYRIGNDLIAELTGGDDDAEYAFLRGHIRPGDIPAELLGANNEVERIGWIIGQIPEKERERRRARLEAPGTSVEQILAGLSGELSDQTGGNSDE